MTPEEINRMIAEWVGIASQYACHADGKIYETCVIDLNERHDCVYAPNIETKEQCNRWMQRCDTPTPDYYRSNAAMDLLGVLVERGYYPCLFFDITRKVWRMSITQIERGMWFAEGNTIPTAICTAILELKERVMDTSIKATEERPDRKIVGWKCSADGKHFAIFDTRRCRYCLPIYEGDKEAAE